MSSIAGIAVKLQKKRDLVPVNDVYVSLHGGLENDVRGHGGKDKSRQVTVISSEQWAEACEDLGTVPRRFPWHFRRANICVSGLCFVKADIGKQLRMGDGVVLEITGETEPCERMNDVKTGLKDALSVDMRGGVTCRVLQAGDIKRDDEVKLGQFIRL